MTDRQERLRLRNLLIAAGARSGLTERQLAVALGMTPAGVHAAIERAEDEWTPPKSERDRNLLAHRTPWDPSRNPRKK